MDDHDADQRNIVLTGFMGTGKSTVGCLLAERLYRPFVDTDDLIVSEAGKPISQIFAEDGESAFRAMESDVARRLAAQSGLVIATGGGMLVNAANRDALSATGLVICLTAAPDVIEARLQSNTGRPLAANWRSLLEVRQAAYIAIPHQIDTSDSDPESAVERILALWQTR